MTRYPLIPVEARLEQVRKMLDQGKTFDEIMQETGLSEATVRVYCYRVKRDGEEYRSKRIGLKQQTRTKRRYTVALDPYLDRKLVAVAEQYRTKPLSIINRIVATVINDNLINAVLED